MKDLGNRCEIHSAAPCAHSRAKIHVFAIHEISLIEQARCLGVAAPNEQARGTHPVDQPRAERSSRRSGPGQRASRIAFCRSSPSGEIIGPNDSSGFPFASTSRGPTIEAPGNSRRAPTSASIEPARNDGVAVQEKDQVARGLTNPFVVSAREADIGRQRNHAERWPFHPHCVDAAIAGRIVYDDDLVRDARRMRREENAGSVSRSARVL